MFNWKLIFLKTAIFTKIVLDEKSYNNTMNKIHSLRRPEENLVLYEISRLTNVLQL